MGKFDWLGLGMAVGIMAVGGAPARASDVQGAFARPLEVTFEPADPDAALRVRIGGVAATADPSGCYTAPACGYLYFACQAGEEALCREQWKEIAAAANGGQCVSFGSRRVGGALANNGRLRPFSEVATNPDLYLASQGMGVVNVACQPSLLTCTLDLSGACAIPSRGDGGAGGEAAAGGRGGGRAGGGTGGGAVGPGGAGGARAGGAGGVAMGGMAGGVRAGAGGGGAAGRAPRGDAGASGGVAKANAAGSGCALASGSGSAGRSPVGLASLALAFALLRRRSRRR